MSDVLNILEKHRDLILLAEIGAALHDIGKLSPGFIIRAGLDDRDRPDPCPPNLHPDEVLREDAAVIPCEMNQTLGQILHLPPDSTQAQLAAQVLSSFLTEHEGDPASKPLLLSLVTLADQRDSGEDQYTVMEVRQRLDVYGATVFGYEADPIDTGCLDDARHAVWAELGNVLENVGDIGNRRDAFMEILADKFSLTRGKTQRAANDITLYQHSRAVATRFKAYLARDLIDPSRQGERKFRLLNVAWDAWHFVVQVPRLSDAAGRRDLIEEFKERVRHLVELECPLGNVVYHDDSTLVALVADLDVEAELRARIEALARETIGGESVPVVQLGGPTTRVTDIVARRRAARQGSPSAELPQWTAQWADRPGAAICPVCGHRPLESNDDPHCGWCGQVRGRGARIRARGERDVEIPRFLPMLVGGARKSLEARGRETVWTGEIADQNGRMALLTGRFNLDCWLNGTLLHTALITNVQSRAQARGWGDYPSPSLTEALESCVQDRDNLSGLIYSDEIKLKQISDRAGDLRAQVDRARQSLDRMHNNEQIPADIKAKRIQAMQEQLDQLKELVWPELSSLQGVLLIEKTFEQYDGDTDQRLCEVAAQEEFSGWPLVDAYATALARKNPSAARLLRVWETTQEFLARAVPEAVETIFNADRALPPQEQQYRYLWEQAQRLRFILEDVPRSLKDGIYTVAVVNRAGEQKELEAFLSNGPGEPPAMITINRLSDDDKAWLEQCVGAGHIEVLARETGRKEPRGDILGIQAAIKDPYQPYHVLTASPEMLVAILPAEIAPRVAQHIQAVYQQEMGKVAGRLPLYLGLFFMDEHFPMFVALDAARRAAECAEHMGEVTEIWRVCETPTITTDTSGAQVYRVTVQPEPDSRGIERPSYDLDVPFQLGNGEPDFYHPYFIVSQAASGFPLEKRTTHLRTPAGYIVHVSELRAGDRLLVYPNRFDFLFLDTVARRFDVRLDDETGRRPHALFGTRYSPRPYLLEDLDRMEEIWQWCQEAGMTTTQLYGIRDLLASRFEEWGLAGKERASTEWQAYENLVAQVLGKEFKEYASGSPQYDGLRHAMLDGLFFDCLELHLQILKEKGV